jgi:hypothetical protein
VVVAEIISWFRVVVTADTVEAVLSYIWVLVFLVDGDEPRLLVPLKVEPLVNKHEEVSTTLQLNTWMAWGCPAVTFGNINVCPWSSNVRGYLDALISNRPEVGFCAQLDEVFLDTGLAFFTVAHVDLDKTRVLLVDGVLTTTLKGEVHTIERPVDLWSVGHTSLTIDVGVVWVGKNISSIGTISTSACIPAFNSP